MSQGIPALLITFFGVIITFLQYRSHTQKRRNEIFDRRFDFYKKFREWWLRLGDQERPADLMELIPWAEEAEFLFGKDISDHILSLEDSYHTGSPFFPNDSFAKPFNKYLKLK